MPGIGIGNAVGLRKMGKPYPTAGLDVIVYNSTYKDGGTTYLRTSKGIGIPKVSGTGLDTIWDFSVLNDVRFDKSNATYWGASLNAWFYYDSENPYHAKLKDFHYKKLNAQVLFDNQIFLKANATLPTNNIIESVHSLYIYSGELQDNDLVKIKKWIGIQDKFYGDEIIETLDFNNWTTVSATVNSATSFTAAVSGGGMRKNLLEIGKTYELKCVATWANPVSGTSGIWDGYLSGSRTMVLNAYTGENDGRIKTFTALTTALYIRGINEQVVVPSLNLRVIYENYYNSEPSVCNVINYGVTLDGISNDTSALFAAYSEYVNTNRSYMYIPTGIALIESFSASALNIYFNEMDIRGDGENSKIIRTGTSSESLFRISEAVNVNVQGLFFDRSNLGDRSCFGISSSMDITLSDLHFRNAINSLATIYSCKNVVLENFTMINTQDNGSSGNHGIDIDLYSYADNTYLPENITIQNGTLDNYGWDACKYENIDTFIFENNECYGHFYSYDDDKRLRNCRNIIIKNNNFYPNKKAGATNLVRAGTLLRDGNILIENNVFAAGVNLSGSKKLTDIFYGCSITHDSENDEITITDIMIGSNSETLATSPLFDIVNILNVGDKFTLPDATGFSTLEFEVIELLSSTSLKASITTSPSQITTLTDVDVTYTRKNNPMVEITGNTFPSKSVITEELQEFAYIHNNIYLNGDSD